MKKNFGTSTIQRKFAHASTIYEKEFHFFNSTLMDYKEQMVAKEIEEEEEKKEEEWKEPHKEKAISLDNDNQKQDKNKETIESQDGVTFKLEELNRKSVFESSSIQLC